MMNLLSRLHSRRGSTYDSLTWHSSQAVPGVRYATRRVSLAQRIELTQRVREISLKHEFLLAGNTSDQLEASLSDLLARKVYIEWGLADIQGLIIDGCKADSQLLLEKGPELLSDEILGMIKNEIGLTEDERKNS